MKHTTQAAALLGALVTAATVTATQAGAAAPSDADGGAELTMLIASSGDAETAAVTEAASAWAEESGNSIEVVVATDMNQQLAQGFASGNPPDIFYLDASRFADNAVAGNLFPYEAEDNDDFYESLRTTFTYDGEQYCAPKDFSTLALQINTASWEAAGLTDEDIPTTYEELATVAEALTTDDQVGLGIGVGIDRLGAFVVGSGGWWLNEDCTAPPPTRPRCSKGCSTSRTTWRPATSPCSNTLDAGWGGEAFGTERAAMVIEGNWIKGAMTNDYPDVEYLTVAMPEGPAGPGTLLFTQCWGVAAESDAQDQAVDLVNYLTSPEQQLAFAEAFGVMPSRQSAAADYEAAFPENAAFIAGGEYGHGPINAPGMEAVVADLNSQLEAIATADLEVGGGELRQQRQKPSWAADPVKTRGPQRQARAGWIFTAPMMIILGLFLVLPIFMALWVSVADWTGRGSPFNSEVGFVGFENYRDLLTEQGLARQDLMISLRNTFYFVIGVVPLQTVLALFLAVIVNERFLKGRTLFRTAFYFPSVVSSVAISLIFLFLFTGTGAVNQFLGLFGIDGPTWFSDPRGLIHIVGDTLGLWSIDDPRRASPTIGAGVVVVGVVQGSVGGADGDHAPGHLDDGGHVHADVPRRAAGRARRGRRGGDGRRRDEAGALPPRDRAAPAPASPPRRHPRHHRDLAGLRPDVHHDPGRPRRRPR